MTGLLSTLVRVLLGVVVWMCIVGRADCQTESPSPATPAEVAADRPTARQRPTENPSPEVDDSTDEDDTTGARWDDPLERFLRRRLGPPLKALHEPVDAWLGSLPMWVAVAAALGLYALAVIWVWTLRTDFVFRGAPDRRRWRDLRIWATVVVLPYVLLYLWLGR